MISPTSARPSAVTLGEGLTVLVARPGLLEDSASFDRTARGAEANVAAVLAAFDVDTAWLSRVGNDGFGRYLVRHLTRRGVDVSGVVVDPVRPTAIYVKERGGGSGAATDLAVGDSRMLYFRAGSAASHASAAGSTMALASMIRPTPKDRASCTCHGVASVIPHAPASSWRAHTCGAIVVLPCGAS